MKNAKKIVKDVTIFFVNLVVLYNFPFFAILVFLLLVPSREPTKPELSGKHNEMAARYADTTADLGEGRGVLL